MIRKQLKFADFSLIVCPLRNHVPDLHYNVKTTMAVIVNKAYLKHHLLIKRKKPYRKLTL